MNLVQAIYLNNQAKPFDNQLVRQALCYAIDRQGIMDMVADGHGTARGQQHLSRVYQVFPAWSWWISIPTAWKRPRSSWPRPVIPTVRHDHLRAQ